MTILSIILIILSIAIIASILLQSGKSAGLGPVDGGASEVFGNKGRRLDEILNKVTIGAGVAFMVLSLLMAAMQ